MTINSINGANTGLGQMSMNQATDSYSKSIQNQIANAQKQLQELSSNENLSLEEKMKRRQEIQQQISDLNMQLRQHQLEQRKEKQQAKDSSMDDTHGGTGNTKAGNNRTGFSQAGMAAMISADSSIKQAKVQGSVATKMEGRSGVLKSEIKQDQARGGNTQKKEEELAEVEQKAQEATSSQISTLAEASRKMEDAARADSREEKEDKDDQDAKTINEKDAEEHVSGTDTQRERVAAQSDVSASKDTAAAENTQQKPASYVSVDIRL